MKQLLNRKSVLGNKKGFTLVEMLVMLAVIGLIAGILFGVMGNVFGDSSVKAAAVQTSDGLRQLNDAAQNYQAQKAAKAADWDTLVTAGMLTTLPPSPSTVGSPAWGYDSTTVAGKVFATLAIPTANAAVCQKINELYAGMGATDAVPATRSTSPLDTKDLKCFGAGPYTVEKSIY